MSKAGARGRVGDINDVMAGRAFDLAPRKLRVALQMLFAMGTFKFELVRRHNVSIPQFRFLSECLLSDNADPINRHQRKLRTVGLPLVGTTSKRRPTSPSAVPQTVGTRSTASLTSPFRSDEFLGRGGTRPYRVQRRGRLRPVVVTLTNPWSTEP